MSSLSMAKFWKIIKPSGHLAVCPTFRLVISFKMGHFRSLLSLASSFLTFTITNWVQMFDIKRLYMTGIEPRTSGVWNSRSANWGWDMLHLKWPVNCLLISSAGDIKAPFSLFFSFRWNYNSNRIWNVFEPLCKL